VASRRTWWVGPDYKRAAEGWGFIRGLVNQIPGAQTREVERIATLPGGGTIEVRSADDPDSLRGAGLDGAVMDEAAYMDETDWTHALRPALSDRRGWAMFLSSTHGRNWFYDLYERAASLDGWARWQRPSSDNPELDPDELEQARRELGADVYAQEYEAQFLDLATVQPFRPEWLLPYDPAHRPPLARLWIAAGLDLAASLKDEACQTALVVVGSQTTGESRDGTIFVLYAEAGHWSPYQALDRLAAVLRAYPVRRLRMERAAYDLAFSHILTRELPIRGLVCPALDLVKHTADKLQRALGVSPLVESGLILFDPATQAALLRALPRVPRDPAAWDLVDAFGLAVTALPPVIGAKSSIDVTDSPARRLARSYVVRLDPSPAGMSGQRPMVPPGWVPGVEGLRRVSGPGVAVARARQRAGAMAVRGSR